MPSKSMPVSQAREIAQKLAREMDVELVDVELVKEPTGHFLRFYIEKPDGVALNDLEAFHRKIMPLVERVEYIMRGYECFDEKLRSLGAHIEHLRDGEIVSQPAILQNI